jgi:methyltransferase (TIGR00027 family)
MTEVAWTRAALDELPGGSHVAWFWEQVASPAKPLSGEDWATHVTRDAFSYVADLTSPGLFVSSLQSGVFASATPGWSGLDGKGQVVTTFTTRSGLRLNAVFLLDAAHGQKISTVGIRLEGGASATAVGTAGVRAAHYAVDEPTILADTLAEALAGEFAAGSIAQVRADPTAVALRHMAAAARARWAEDTVADAQAEGVDQYVLLGAGLDSFAYRRADPDDGLRIFEVDQPASQRWKLRRLAEIGIGVPGSVKFVSVDFETQDFGAELAKVGFDPRRPSVVAWMGVTYFLTRDAIVATLGRVASWAPGTRLVFDYYLPERLWDSFVGWDGNVMRGTAAFVAASGEPFINFFTPDEVEALLRAQGYDAIEHLDHDAVRSIYMGDHPPGPPGPVPWVRVVRAVVAEPE